VPVTLRDLRNKLRQLADPERAATLRWFLKAEPGGYGEGDRFHGIRVPALRSVAKEYNELSLADVRKLLRSRYHEERMVALFIMVRRYEKGDSSAREAVFAMYREERARINNWDLVDGSAPRNVGAHLLYRDRKWLYELAASHVLWDRRIAIISTFTFIRNDDYSDTLEIARILLEDRHDLIHKAVGWMLREIGNRHRATEVRFLERHVASMPRTMLRYAIEKFPEAERRLWLNR
jgi:3-methyladenine DNA glycosylase AlkD